MAPRIHPCICGFTSETYSQMKHHREGCVLWQTRPDPMTLMINRRRKTRWERADRKFEPCPICQRRPDHHDPSCPNSQAEVVRREALRKNGIDPRIFEVFLKLLAKKYRDEGLMVGGVVERVSNGEDDDGSGSQGGSTT